MRQGWRVFALLLALPLLLVLHGVRSGTPIGDWNTALSAAGSPAAHGSLATPPGLSSDVSGILTPGPARASSNPNRVGPGAPAAEPAVAATTNPAILGFALVESPGHRLLPAGVTDHLRGRAPPALTAVAASR